MDFRLYDNALGRFIALDALAEQYHTISPYQFGNNNPIFWADPTGLYALKFEWDYEDVIIDRNSDLTSTARNGMGGGGGGGASWGSGFGGGGGGSGSSGFSSAQDLLDFMNKEMKRLGVNKMTYTNNNNGTFSYSYWVSAIFEQNGSKGGSALDLDEFIVGMRKVTKTYSLENVDYHSLAMSLRKFSGYALAIQKPLELAFRSGTMYPSQLYASHTSNVVFQKNILGQKIHIPLGEYKTSSIGNVSKFLKITGRVLGAAAVISGGISIYNDGLNWSNGLDTAMAALALSPTGVGQAIAGVYFLSNAITQFTTGKDIGQHIQDQIDGN